MIIPDHEIREITNTERFLGVLAGIKEDYADRLDYLRGLTAQIKAEELSLEEMVDIGYLLRECESVLDEMRKDFKAHKERIGKVACQVIALKDEVSWKGTLATGTAKATFYSKIPHPEHRPEAFANVCKWFNIDIGDGPVGYMRLHWPTIKRYITDAMERGESLPPELSDVQTDYEMTYRRRTNGVKDES